MSVASPFGCQVQQTVWSVCGGGGCGGGGGGGGSLARSHVAAGAPVLMGGGEVDDDCHDSNDAGSQSLATSSAVVERLRLTIDG